MRPSRPGRLVLAALAVAVATAAACSSPPAPQATPARPDVLLVTIDTLRADRLTPATMPALTALAARGTMFATARTVAPLTLPAHASVLTGLYPAHHGVRLNGVHALPATTPRLSTLLRAAGYQTAAFVGAYVLDRRFGLADGFGTYDDRIPRGTGAVERLDAERRGETVVDAALAWLRAPGRRRDAPVFVWVHLYDPHAPYEAPAAFVARAGGSAYDGEVAYADAQLSRLLEAFAAARGAALVVVAGDHGESLGDHGEPTHGMLLYESALRVPIVISGAGVSAARRTDPVSLVDLAPTILAKAGVPGLTRTDGIDVLADGAARAVRATYSETEYPRLAGWAPLAAVVAARWKLVEAPRPELYDVERDPAERENVGASRADVLGGLRHQLDTVRSTRVADAGTGQPVSAEVAAKLRALGYVAAAAPRSPASGATAPNPAAMMDAWAAFEGAIEALRVGRANEGVTALRDLARAHADSALFATTYARALAAQGRHRDALRVYRDAATRWPGDSLLLHDLAVSAREAGEWDEARRSEEAALVVDPSNALAQNGLGLLLADVGRDAEARSAFEKAATLDPTNAAYAAHVGNAARAQGDLAGAERAYRAALAIDADLADGLNGLGVVLVQTGRAAEAVPVLERAAARDAGFVEARLNLGIARQESGDPEGARAAYRQVLLAPARFTKERAAARQLLAALGGRSRR